jgi:HlyD family secretion protein
MSAAHSPIPVQDPKLSPVSAPGLPPETGSRKWLIWLLLAALIIVGVIAWWATRPARQASQTAISTGIRTVAAVSGTLDRTVRVTGQTSAIEFANITAPMMRGPDSNREMVLMKVAPAGTWVKKGTRVAQIDAQSMQDHVDDLGDTIQTAQADVDRRRAEHAIELENLLQNVRLTKSEVDKARLEYNGSETQTEIQRQLLKLNLDESEARYKELQADIAQTKASQAAELRILQLTLERHTRHRDRHVRDIRAFTVYASMDGLVVMQQIWRGSEMGQVQGGDRLFPGQPFMKIVNTKKMQVEGNINQAESSEFRIGQPARINLDAFKGLQFNGKVHSIGALANGGWRNSYYVRTVPIRIDIEGNDPRLIPDLSAGVDVIMSSAPNQTIVPLNAISTEDGKPVVYVKSGDTFDRREVQVGLRNETHAAIASGLRPGERVRLN